MHSENYLARNNNPQNRFKPFKYHREHFITRLKERFEIEITEEEYANLVDHIGSGEPKKIYSINEGNTVYSMIINGKEVWVLYGRKGNKLPARLKTAMLPHRFLVPDCVSHLFNHETFTNEVIASINSIKKLSEDIDLEDKVKFFSRKDLPEQIKFAALKFKEFNNEFAIEVMKPAINIIKLHYSNMKKI